MRQVQQNLLPKISDNQLHASVLNIDSGSVTVAGFVTIAYTLDLSVPQITLTVSIYGVTIGGGTLNSTNPSLTIGGSSSGFKAQGTITADFSASNLTYALTACAPIAGCTNYNGTLYSW